jgi:hypothetical protein
MQITVTRALAQIKSLEDRIARATSNPFVSFRVGEKSAGGSPVAEVEATLKANMQSVKAMIAQRDKLKAAVIRSNAVVAVTIGGEVMTVAEAIERKGSIRFEQSLLANLKSQAGQARLQVERKNQEMQTRLDTLLQTAVGKDRKITDEDMGAIGNPFKLANEAFLIDPLKVDEEIAQLEKKIDAFVTEVDYALSEKNATTQIEVEDQ